MSEHQVNHLNDQQSLTLTLTLTVSVADDLKSEAWHLGGFTFTPKKEDNKGEKHTVQKHTETAPLLSSHLIEIPRICTQPLQKHFLTRTYARKSESDAALSHLVSLVKLIGIRLG